ncbi:MAG: hypothetical protein A2Z74_07485 [Chloroflexi bacterium RBG_13_46_9]|nr:MAG: hypothetical protein A2Z74_07485 [Chloroflexi bacterium RBG_13_46_9]
MNDVTGYYQISVHPSNINIWYTSLLPRRRPYRLTWDNDESHVSPSSLPEQFINNKHQGRVSPIAAKKITRAIDYLVYLAQPKKLPHTLHGKGLKWKVNIVTLTLASTQIHSDNEIKSHLLEPFLNSCRQKWQITNYIWRAEKQKNGNLHFHLITDKFIPWNELRNVWNRHQQRLQYVTRYREHQITWHDKGFRFRPELAKDWPLSKQRNAYEAGVVHDWNNPNSTDVHSLRRINNVRAYFIKYMTKQSQSGNIDGRLWGCSSSLVNLKGARNYSYGALENEIHHLMKHSQTHTYSSEFFTSVYFPSYLLQSDSFPELTELFETYLSLTFPSYRPPGLFDQLSAG